MPGTYYHWTVSGGPYSFNLADKNVTLASITFNAGGSYWVKCVYNNPLAGCNGVDSIQVNILPVFTINGNDKVCESDVVYYFANGPATWIITPAGATILTGNGSSVISASFPPGNFVVTATPVNPAAFCNLTAFKNVQVIAKPILGSITGPVTVCPGDNLTYSITSNVTGSPFVWSVSSGTGTILSQMGADNNTIIVTLTGTGPWTLSVYQQIEISPGNYCASLTKTLNVNSYPGPSITGNTTACVDALDTYVATGGNPSGTFQWTITPSNRGTIQSGQGTNTVIIQWHGPATTAFLKVTACSGFFTLPIVINGPPNAVASYSTTPLFCLGVNQTITFSTPFGAGYTYQWYKNNTAVGGNSNTLTVSIPSILLAGTYQYYVMVTLNGCSVNSNIINLVIEDCSAGGNGGGPGPGNCDAVAFFRTYTVCDLVTLINKSSVAPPNTITNYQWTISGPGTGTFSPNANAMTPGLTVSASGTYTITLTVTSSSGCTSTWVEYVNVLLPVANFTYTTPVCENIPATFTAIPNNPLFNYSWSFGDGATSYIGSTQHEYASAALSPYNINLVITDQAGCVATSTYPITVNPTPNCTIIPSDTIFCPGGSVNLTACYGMSAYQWYKDGAPIPLATGMNYTVTQFGKYWVQMTNIFGCMNISNKVYIYEYSLPIAKITGETEICATPGYTSQFYLSSVYNSNYYYSWSSIPAGATFTPPNNYMTLVNLTLPLTLPINYQFIVNVTDTTTGCTATDTICVVFVESPTLSVNYLGVCVGQLLQVQAAYIRNLI
ncbi:MAG: PKD domain-containing protein [Bacteroidia bacterium]|nr:PKD domain-containing protein [Bacteroidia bacterium]